jgi:hypothetical protein
MMTGSMTLPSPPHHTTKRKRGEIRFRILTWTAPVVGVLYSLARLVIIAVAFGSLRAMPEGVYDNNWTKYVPNISWSYLMAFVGQEKNNWSSVMSIGSDVDVVVQFEASEEQC